MGKRKRNREKEKWEGRKEKEGGRCAPAATAGAVGHARRAARGRWGTRRRRERKKERGKRRGGIRGGRSRRVALDGKEMGRGLKFGCRVVRERLWEFRVQGLSRAQRKTTLAHDLLSEFSGCYKPTPLKMNLVLEIRLVPKQVGKLLL